MGLRQSRVYTVDDVQYLNLYKLHKILVGKCSATDDVIHEARRVLVIIHNRSGKFLRAVLGPTIREYQQPQNRHDSSFTAETHSC